VISWLTARLKYTFSPKKKFYNTLRKYLGFFPHHIEYYELAFLHRSASILDSKGGYINNERLEFLGDSVLDAVVADFLYFKFPQEDEGFLTQMRSKIVNGESLSVLARKLKLNRLVVTNTNQNISKKHIYEDAFEAFLGAMYLDKGYEVVRKYIIKFILNKHIDIETLLAVNTNYKSQLIEWSQKTKNETEFYTDLENPQSRYFICYIRINRETICTALGMSKKEAEQKAARVALEKIETIYFQ